MNAIVNLRPADFTNTQLTLIRNTVAADTNQNECDLFIHTARHLRLDPLRRQIYAFVYNKKSADKRKMSIIVGIDGFRAIADRTGNYRPDEDEATFEIDPALKGQANPAGIVKATVRVWKHSHGAWHKVTSSAFWDEYAPLKEGWSETIETQNGTWPDGNPKMVFKPAPGATRTMTLDTSGQWGKMPRVMLAKVAEALALRKAWPDDFSNVDADEEVDRTRAADMTAWEAAEAGATEKRLAQIGQGQTVMFQFDPTGPLEPVPLGKIADRVAEFVEKMRFPPEKVYPTVEGAHAWLVKQLDDDIRAALGRPALVADVRRERASARLTMTDAQRAAADRADAMLAAPRMLVADPRTEAEISARLPPSYAVIIKAPNGMFTELRDAQDRVLRFVGDINAATAGPRVAAVAEAAALRAGDAATSRVEADAIRKRDARNVRRAAAGQ